MKRKKTSFAVPDAVLIPAANARQKEFHNCADSFNDHESQKLKESCGPDYAHVPQDEIRIRAGNLRKKGVLDKLDGHGPRKLRPPSETHLEYLRSPHWVAFAKRVREAWGFKCAMCDRKRHDLDVHHNNYDRLKCERSSDCIPVCRTPCHPLADRCQQNEQARQKADEKKNGKPLF